MMGRRYDALRHQSLSVVRATPTLSCKHEIVATLSVGGGQTLGTSSLDFTISCVGSPNGNCPCPCNYIADAGCTCRDLEAPLTLVVTKSQVWASYPMQYLQSFNYKPYEAIVRPSNDQCSASGSNPTCGWYYVGSYQVPDSQGFVCDCSFTDVWDTTLGVANEQRTRANLDCDFFSNPLNILVGNPPCSAHCLMFDPLWYSVSSDGSCIKFEACLSIVQIIQVHLCDKHVFK
ncbi:hypothetical protein CEUSTIGMA_g11694.t1 [Chlamydomonas eustigma]|uniref:Generative cell specific-1/HAP2 domain-containing protein n=1 Tax=Chlamydomonas eustigma TaxID=1157962 RepID=A0A250XMD8_9CHLO|nr:hypothetical protein CEUSTIGMA_g11694.t1 [Chlamydomonas eustigma]|eukprot:GAX84271.1 hypothetical protein CEUSTIGMA_g11694.t1 [Chlamydomonas eustigma]